MDIFTAPTLNTLPARSPIVSRPIAPPFITEYLNSGDGFTRVRMSDGTVQTLQGTRADRNNNPGNLTGTMAGAQRRGAIGIDHGGNYVFPTVEAGRKAMAEMVLNENANKSIGDMIEFYAPKPKRDPETGELIPVENDPNNTNRFYPGLIAGQGFNLNDRVGSLAPAQQQALLGAMMGVEGYSGAPVAQPVSFPLQQRAQNSGILPMIGGGAMAAARGFDDFVLGGATGSMINSGRNFLDSAGNMVAVARGNMTEDEFKQRGRDMLQRDTSSDILFPGAVGRAVPAIAAAGKAVPKMLPKTGALFAPMATAIPTGGGDTSADLVAPTPTPAKASKNYDDAPLRAARKMGLLGDPDVAATVAQTTASAADAVANSPKEPKPLTKEERKKWSPESLGLIAFGLSLLGGSDIDDAMRMGLQTYNGFQDREDRKDREKRIDEFISKQDPETQELMRLLGDDMGAIANVALAQKEQDAAVGQKAALIERAAAVTGQDPETLAALDADQLKNAINDTVFADAAGPDGKKFTANQQEAAMTALQMKQAGQQIIDLYTGDDAIRPGMQGFGRGLAFSQADKVNQANAAIDQFVAAYLPFVSGQDVKDSEVNRIKNLIKPKGGMGQEQANMERLQRIITLTDAVIAQSGGAYDYLVQNPANSGISIPTVEPAYSNPYGVIAPGGQ
jgi:hypothetical protein